MNVDEDQMEIENIAAQETTRSAWITFDRLILLALIIISVLAAIVLLFVPEKIGWALVALPIVIFVCVITIQNPFIGVFGFLTYSNLRPYSFMPFLIPLRLSMVMEVLTLVAWIVSLAVHKNRIKWSPVHTWFAIFLFPIGLGIITAANNFYPYEVMQAIMVHFVIFVIATNVMDSMKRLNLVVWMLLLVYAYFSIKGIHTFTTGAYTDVTGNTSGRVTGGGFISDENDFALTINMMVPFAFFGFQYLKGKAKFVCGGLLVLFVLAVVASFSRGGLVGLAAVVVFGIATSQRKLIASSIVLLLLVTMFMFAPDRYWKEAESISDIGEATADARLNYWGAGLNMFLDNPIIGVGAGNGKIHLPRYYNGPGDPNRHWGRAFHGSWPQILAELGLMGAVPYFMMLFLSFRHLWLIRRESKDDDDPTGRFLANGLIGSLIAYQVCATFLSTAYYPQAYLTYTLVWAFVFCYKATPKNAIGTRKTQTTNSGQTLPKTNHNP